MTNPIFKLHLTIFLPVAIFLLVGGFYTLNGEIDREVGKLKNRQESEVFLAAETIRQNLQVVSNDVLILSESSLLKEYFENPQPQFLNALKQDFLSTARRRIFYHQIRWLDQHGKESIRIDTDKNQSRAIPENNLQNKSNRYYFTDAVKLNQGEIYFSRFDLNVEKGEIEKPYRPMLRVATSVYDTGGQNRGIVIVNFSGKKLIADFQSQFIGSDIKHAMLVDGFGYWLSSSNKNAEWAFMFKKDIRFSQQYPEMWNQLKEYDFVQELTGQGLFTARKVLINPSLGDNEPKNLLHIISFVSQAEIDEELFNARSKIWGSVIALLLLSYLGAWVLAKSLLEAEKNRRSLAINEVKGQLLNSMAEGVVGIDAEGQCSFVNTPAMQQLGYAEADLLGKEVHQMIHFKNEEGEEIVKASCPVTQALETGEISQSQESFIRKDGSFLPVELISNPVFENGLITGAVLTFRDITEKLEAQRQIHQLSNYDRITNLPNRKLFAERVDQLLETELAMNRTSVFLTIDIDRFSAINESIGMDAGNMLLISFADRIKSLLRNKDMIGRIGPDEFAILIHEAGADNALTWVNRLNDILESPFKIIDKEYRLSVSIGICLLPLDADNANDAFINAEIALLRSKANSIEKVHFFSKAMQEQSFNAAKIEHDLLAAISNDELFLQYQPQIARHNQQVTGAEALVRWKHPVEGIISPGEFIPVAEKTGIIGKVDQWVLVHAIKKLSEWEKTLPGQNFSIAVNLSPESFLSPELPGLLKRLIDESRVPAKRIELEITERSMVSNPDLAADRMSIFKEIGVKLSIDDFGTGYSSLGYLKKLPIDILKIDQSFVRDLLTDKNNASIVMAIVSMAKALDLKTIAEGIEEEKELAFLNQINCDIYQGFYFSRPISPADFEKWVLNQS